MARAFRFKFGQHNFDPNSELSKLSPVKRLRSVCYRCDRNTHFEPANEILVLIS